MRFLTWMKKETSNGESSGGKGKNSKQQALGRTLYFDYENEWRIKVSTSSDLQVDDPKFLENELMALKDDDLRLQLGAEALEYLRDDVFETEHSFV